MLAGLGKAGRYSFLGNNEVKKRHELPIWNYYSIILGGVQTRFENTRVFQKSISFFNSSKDLNLTDFLGN